MANTTAKPVTTKKASAQVTRRTAGPNDNLLNATQMPLPLDLPIAEVETEVLSKLIKKIKKI